MNSWVTLIEFGWVTLGIIGLTAYWWMDRNESRWEQRKREEARRELAHREDK